MKPKINNKFTFPVGYIKFHKKQLFNFQLNRWYSMGYLPYEELQTLGGRVSDFKTWKIETKKLAEIALTHKKLVESAFYFRAAEFYLLPEDDEKDILYEKFSELFYKAFENENIEIHKVPYIDSFLHILRIPPTDNENNKGTILLHGGFDSFIEEFYSMMKCFSENGYEVIGFDGPGQGATLKNNRIAFDYQWEKPTKAILDYFQLEDVTLIGLSMGGWLCLRAAAFEKRIKRVIASGHVYDYYKIPPLIAQWLMNIFNKKFKNYSNSVALKQIKKGGMEGWKMSNLMYMTKIDVPMSAFDYAMQMNEKNLHSELVNQDVLILTGRNDHFIPYKLHDKQIKLLSNAKSLTDRVFTKHEHAQNHCQIGNFGLAIETMQKWIEEQ